jgi:hypothetical protein
MPGLLDLGAGHPEGEVMTPVVAKPEEAGCWIDSSSENCCARLVLIARDRGWTEDSLSDRGEEQAGDALERAVAIALAELAVLKGEDNLPEELQDALGFKYAVEAEEWLDAHCTPAGYTMGWSNLSFFFQPVTWWETETVNGRPDEY